MSNEKRKPLTSAEVIAWGDRPEVKAAVYNPLQPTQPSDAGEKQCDHCHWHVPEWDGQQGKPILANVNPDCPIHGSDAGEDCGCFDGGYQGIGEWHREGCPRRSIPPSPDPGGVVERLKAGEVLLAKGSIEKYMDGKPQEPFVAITEADRTELLALIESQERDIELQHKVIVLRGREALGYRAERNTLLEEIERLTDKACQDIHSTEGQLSTLTAERDALLEGMREIQSKVSYSAGRLQKVERPVRHGGIPMVDTRDVLAEVVNLKEIEAIAQRYIEAKGE